MLSQVPSQGVANWMNGPGVLNQYTFNLGSKTILRIVSTYNKSQK